MTISKKNIDNDISFIFDIIKKKGFVIPSFFSCSIPGLILFLLLTSWQVFIAYPLVHFDKMAKLFSASSVLFSCFIGFSLFIAITNATSKYLSFPLEVRRGSIIFKLLTRKVFSYALIWFFLNLLSGLTIKHFDFSAAFSSGIQFISLILIYFIALIDLGRYDFTLLNSLIALSRKSGHV